MGTEFEDLIQKHNEKCEECERLYDAINDFDIALTHAKALLIEHGITEEMQTACKSEIE